MVLVHQTKSLLSVTNCMMVLHFISIAITVLALIQCYVALRKCVREIANGLNGVSGAPAVKPAVMEQKTELDQSYNRLPMEGRNVRETALKERSAK